MHGTDTKLHSTCNFRHTIPCNFSTFHGNSLKSFEAEIKNSIFCCIIVYRNFNHVFPRPEITSKVTEIILVVRLCPALWSRMDLLAVDPDFHMAGSIEKKT